MYHPVIMGVVMGSVLKSRFRFGFSLQMSEPVSVRILLIYFGSVSVNECRLSVRFRFL